MIPLVKTKTNTAKDSKLLAYLLTKKDQYDLTNPESRLNIDQKTCWLLPAAAAVGLKTLAYGSAKTNATMIGNLKNTITTTVEPLEDMVKVLKSNIDGQVKNVMQPLNEQSVNGSMALFGLSFVILALA